MGIKILVINRGSSTLKCHLYDSNTIEKGSKPLWESHLEWGKNGQEIYIKIKNHKGEEYEEETNQNNPIHYLLQFLIEGNTRVLAVLDEIDVVGHRIVHGGRKYQKSVCINKDVKEQIRLLCDLAPLHNPPGLEGIEIFEKLIKNKPQIAVFDTAFHHTISPAAAIYPGPYQWYEEGIQRYGFHGISYQYCSKRASEMLNTDLSKLNIIACHLGSGASLCAIKNGKSIDTTMGFTPLEGLMMNTRSGSIDPGILLYLLEKNKMDVEELSETLNKKSGLLGVSGVSSDMREVLKASIAGNEQAKLALEIYVHRLASLIGSMAASLNGANVLIFTAGIGENSQEIREHTCKALSFLGFSLDKKKNERKSSEDCDLSEEHSKNKILLIHTKEELEIARECLLVKELTNNL